jgi:hypothetical protein
MCVCKNDWDIREVLRDTVSKCTASLSDMSIGVSVKQPSQLRLPANKKVGQLSHIIMVPFRSLEQALSKVILGKSIRNIDATPFKAILQHCQNVNLARAPGTSAS